MSNENLNIISNNNNTSKSKKIWNVKEILDWTLEYFTAKGIENPRLEAELLLSTALKCPRIELYVSFNRPVNDNERTTLRNWVKRRVNFEPLAYILGEQEFYSLKFKVGPGVLIPRPETEHIIEEGIAILDSAYIEQKISHFEILDLCTGSACIPIALEHYFLDGFEKRISRKININNPQMHTSQGQEVETQERMQLNNADNVDSNVDSNTNVDDRAEANDCSVQSNSNTEINSNEKIIAEATTFPLPQLNIIASDISPEALNYAKDNIELHKKNIKLITSDSFQNIPKQSFHLITVNPPYISEDYVLPKHIAGFEPNIALKSGSDGLLFIQEFLKNAKNFLKPKGIILMEIGFDQKLKVETFCKGFGYSNVSFIKDLAGHDRVVRIQI